MSDTLTLTLAGIVVVGLMAVRIWAQVVYNRFIDELPEAERRRIFAHRSRALY